MEHRARVEQFRVDLQAALLAGQRREVVHAARVVEQQRGFGIADQLRDVAGQLAVGNGDVAQGELHG
ncbi:hypothetical protein D3C85_1758600 [compost metagenome]